MADSLEYSEYQYGSDHELQKLGVWTFPGDPNNDEDGDASEVKYWIVYIHGGAWRDPRIDRSSILPAITALLKDNNTHPGTTSRHRRFAGFASLDYRLSPHPDFPQGPQEPRPRTARHPDHLRDVRAGLALLRRELGVGSSQGAPYVLYGHSCGATLALQVLMGEEALGAGVTAGAESEGRGGGREGEGRESQRSEDVPPPAAVVGFQGMYDLPALNSRSGDAYRGLLKGAFGLDEDVWADVSPARFGGSFRAGWGGDRASKRVVTLAYSPQDELIDMPEIDAMERVLRRDGLCVLTYRDLEGLHDEVWQNGRHIARVLRETIEKLDKLDKLDQS